jgi:hypothetical protein
VTRLLSPLVAILVLLALSTDRASAEPLSSRPADASTR